MIRQAARMSSRTRTVRTTAAIAAFGVAALSVVAWTPPAVAQTNQITLTGSVSQNCTITVTADPNASSLNLTGGATRIQIGTVVQNCNKKSGYTIVVTSANCGTAPTGAKLVGTASGDTLSYSAESVNPSTGGSNTDVTGLLASACTGQNARTVTNAKISNETSTVFANYTGNASLSADTYTDTLTFTMNVN